MNFESKQVYIKLFDRYQSETRKNILVTTQSSTYVEFQLKRGDSNDDKQIFLKIHLLFDRTKDFVLHQTLFLVIAGIFGS
jgi:hypothetical protein